MSGPLESRPRRVSLIDTQPRGWVEAAMPIHDSYRVGQNPRERQIQRWMGKTGESPTQSSFTIVVPIQDNERTLPSFLASLRMLDVPSDANMRVIFLTQRSTDKSQFMIDEFLKKYMEDYDEGYLVAEKDYPRLGLSSSWAYSGNINYLRMSTPLQGKTTALSIANKMAIERSEKIAMCLDPEVYPEPDAIKNMYAAALETMVRKADGTVLLSASPKPDNRERLAPVFEGCMAWQTDWFGKINISSLLGNVGYGMSMIARLQGLRVDHVPDAFVWYHPPANPVAIYQSLARKVQGIEQLKSLGPQAVAIIEADKSVPSLARRFPFLFGV